MRALVTHRIRLIERKISWYEIPVLVDWLWKVRFCRCVMLPIALIRERAEMFSCHSQCWAQTQVAHSVFEKMSGDTLHPGSRQESSPPTPAFNTTEILLYSQINEDDIWEYLQPKHYEWVLIAGYIIVFFVSLVGNTLGKFWSCCFNAEMMKHNLVRKQQSAKDLLIRSVLVFHRNSHLFGIVYCRMHFYFRDQNNFRLIICILTRDALLFWQVCSSVHSFSLVCWQWRGAHDSDLWETVCRPQGSCGLCNKKKTACLALYGSHHQNISWDAHLSKLYSVLPQLVYS